MPTPAIETDYLVIGAGATAMAFVDTLLSEDADATVLMVDRHHRPGAATRAVGPIGRAKPRAPIAVRILRRRSDLATRRRGDLGRSASSRGR